MSILKTVLAIPVAMAIVVTTSSITQAQCTGCSSGRWPTGCSSCAGGGSALAGARANFDQFKADFELVTNRNAAWPKPFSCWDKDVYYTVFNQQYSAGSQVAHTLSSQYFDSNTNELNRAGEARVAWIMQNSPASDRSIFVFEDTTGPALEQRLAAVRDVVDRWYGHFGEVLIAATRVAPNAIPATYQQTIMQQYSSAQPQPVIPIQAGSGINQAVGGN